MNHYKIHLLPILFGYAGKKGKYSASNQNNKGFTLLELVMVIAIISALGAIAIPIYKRNMESSKVTEAIQDLKMIDREITLFKVDHRRLPDTLAELGLGNLSDPWDNPYRYLNFDTIKGKGKGKMRKDHSLVPINSDYDLYSMGPDGDSKPPFTAKASRDDIVRANNGSFFGEVANY